MRLLTDGFSEVRKNISASYLKVDNRSMGEIRFCTTSKGGLSHLPYISCQMEPPGIEYNNVNCSAT